ncbi:MAG: NmrA family NAD(P)-binding protein [Myxococcota bacterium]
MDTEILITGATGTTGGHLTTELKRKGTPFRALVRTPGQAEALHAAGVETVVGDLTKPETLRAALTGIKRAFLLTPGMPFHPESIVMAQNFAAEAKRAGVCHIVLQSVWGISADADKPRLLRDHAKIRDAVEDAGIPLTLLRANFGMQSLAAQGMLATAEAEGVAASPLGEVGVGYVDLRDVAAVAAVCLTEDSHAGREYKLSGPEVLTLSGLASALGAVFERDVQGIEPTQEQSLARLRSLGMPQDVIDEIGVLTAYNRTGALGDVSPNVQGVLGRAPTSFRRFVEDSRAGG